MDEAASRRGGGRAALILGAALLVLCAGAGVLTGLAHQLTLGHVAVGAGMMVFGLTGVVVAYHQPRNPVGWILISFPFLYLIGADAQYYAVLRYHLGHSGLPFGPAAVLPPQSVALLATSPQGNTRSRNRLYTPNTS